MKKLLTPQREAVLLAQRIVDGYEQSAEDYNLLFAEFMERINWPNDYKLSRALLDAEDALMGTLG